MLKRVIISIIICLLIISNIVLVLILFVKNNNNAVGIYHNSHWNNQEAVLQLNGDSTCKYPNSNHICKWTISDKNIIIELSYYEIVDVYDNQYYGNMYNTLEKCKKNMKKLKDIYDFKNPICKLNKNTYEATLTDSGIILYEKLFNKIG